MPDTLLVSEIKLNPDNPRIIKDEKFQKLVKSLKEFPEMADVREIVVNKDHMILGGNMRFKAMVEAGWTKIPVKIVNWSEDKQREFVIKDNTGYGEWEWGALAEQYEAEELLDWGMDLPKNFNIDTPPEDTPPAVSAEPAASIPGEVYQLGEHRLMCGDATLIGDVKKLVGTRGGVDMVFTDPPYNVDYVGKTKDSLKIKNDKFTDDGFLQFLKDAFNNMSAVVKSGASIYVCHADSEGLNFRKAFIESGFLLKQCIIWNKNSMVMGRQDYQWKHEPILYGWKEGGSHSWFGDRAQTTVWDIDRPTRSEEHPTMKPTALIVKALENSSKSGDLVLDLFGGSGSTLIACEFTKRACLTMELDPKYCDVIRKRYWMFTHDEDENGWLEGTQNVIETAEQQGVHAQ